MSASSRDIEQLLLFDDRDDVMQLPSSSGRTERLNFSRAHPSDKLPSYEIGRFHRFRVLLVDSKSYTREDWLYSIDPQSDIVSSYERAHWCALVRVALHYQYSGEETTLLKRYADKRLQSLESAAMNILGPVDLTPNPNAIICQELYQCMRNIFFEYLRQNDDVGYRWVGYTLITRF